MNRSCSRSSLVLAYLAMGEHTLAKSSAFETGSARKDTRYALQLTAIRSTSMRYDVSVIVVLWLTYRQIANGRNLTSWPVPPDSKFMCTPVSERIYQSTSSFERRTWCAVRRRDQVSIACYEQTKRDGQATSSTSIFPLKSKAAVVKLEPVDAAERLIVAVQEDGTLNIYVSDAKQETSTHQLLTADENLKILAVHCSSLAAAQKAFLKSRSDIAAGLSTNSIAIACVHEVAGSKEIQLNIWTVSLDKHASNENIQAAVNHKLGSSFASNSAKRTSVEIKAGSLIELRNGARITSYDLTTITPQRQADFFQPLSECVSDLEVTHSLYLCANATKMQLYNKDFGSVLASTELSGSTLKRKRDQDGSKFLSFIAYFSQMRRALACIGNQVLAIDILTEDVTSFKQSSLLIGNILRGAEKHAQNNIQPDKLFSIGKFHTEEPVPNWPLVSKELDSLVDRNDAQGFEEIFKKTFNLHRAKDLNSSKVPDSKMNYLLSKMFAIAAVDGNPDQKRLKVMLLPQELMQWSISGGYVDSHRIDQALGDKVTSRRPDAISLALTDADPSMQLLEFYLKNSPFLDPEVLRLCIHVLMRKVLEGEESSYADAKTGLVTNSCLLQALKRFALTGASVVSKQLRDYDRTIILPIIQVLRQQMFLGGYGRLARSYPSPPPSEDGKNSTNAQLDLASIVILLNGCVDAIGPLGIFGTDDAYGSIMQRVVPELLSEVAAACQGVEDSTMLQGLVRETLRYSESVERQPFEVRQKTEIKNSGKGAIKGQVVTLYAEPEVDDGGIEAGPALPLSLKAEEDLSGVKVRKGGQKVKRSAREMGMLKDRLKSAYSFERLIL